ncbi:MATE family efflux transporter [Acholeplasma granularum]|uniref:MATE family efflux transporter n=1 Tax=Acholeplasma granularum TaxID=264635 RepID=UPI00138B100D|nr:MATE family efflux transporter [Acholeplasma granularum]
MSKNTYRMLTGKRIWLYMLLLSLPILINNLIKSFNSMVDIYFIARMDNATTAQIDSAIAALNIHESFNNLILAIGVGLSIAAMAIVSQFLGAKKENKARSYSGQLLMIAIIVGILLTLIIVSFSWLFIDLLGAKEQTFDNALVYFNIRSFELVGVIFFLVYQAIRQAQGSTIIPTLLNISGIILNIILTWYFVSILNLGVEGAAWSTVIGNLVFVPLMIIDLLTSKKYIKINPKSLIPKLDTLKEIWPFAYPATVSHSVTFFGFLIINGFVLTQFGDVVSASFSTGNKLSNLLMNPIYAITTISAVFIGTNIGNKQPERALQAYKESGLLTFTITVVAISIAILFRRDFVIMLVGNSNPKLIEISIQYTFWLLLTQPFMSIFQNHMAIFNGSGQSKIGLKAQSIRLWLLRIPILFILWWIFPQMSYSVVWTAMNISNVLAVFYVFYLRKNITLDIRVNLEDEISEQLT